MPDWFYIDEGGGATVEVVEVEDDFISTDDGQSPADVVEVPADMQDFALLESDDEARVDVVEVLDNFSSLTDLTTEDPLTWFSESKQGPAGRDGSGEQVLAVHYGDVSGALLATVPAGHLSYRLLVAVLVAFDGEGAALSVGTSADHELVFSSDLVDLTAVGTYEFRPAFESDTDTTLRAWLTSGTSPTQGYAKLVLAMEE